MLFIFLVLYCLHNCQFSQSFDIRFIITDKCNKTKTRVDYNQKLIHVRFGSTSLTDKYDYIREVTIIDKIKISINPFLFIYFKRSI